MRGGKASKRENEARDEAREQPVMSQVSFLVGVVNIAYIFDFDVMKTAG